MKEKDFLLTSRFYVCDGKTEFFLGNFNVNRSHIKKLLDLHQKTNENLIDSYVELVYLSWGCKPNSLMYPEEHQSIMSGLSKLVHLNLFEGPEVRIILESLHTQICNYYSCVSAKSNSSRRIASSFTSRPEVRNEVISTHGSACLSCGDETDITMDHVKPIAIGGGNTVDNLQPLCRSCNSKKGTKEKDYRIKNLPRNGKTTLV